MEEKLLTIEQVKEYFQVKDNRTIYKFVQQGLKCFHVREQRHKV